MPASKKRWHPSRTFTETRLIPLQLPWGEKASFQGVIDLIEMKAYKGDGKTAEAIPADLQKAAEDAHKNLVEVAAEGDDALMEKYFDKGELTHEETLKGLALGIQKMHLCSGTGFRRFGRDRHRPVAGYDHQSDAFTAHSSGCDCQGQSW